MRNIKRKISAFLLYTVAFTAISYISSKIPHKGGFSAPPIAHADDPHNDGSDGGDSCDAADASDCI